MQRSDCYWLAMVVAAALAFSIWGLPYFSQLGHPLWSVVVYAFFVVLFLYGRANHYPRSKVRQSRNSPK
jgi:hypothetical protein